MKRTLLLLLVALVAILPAQPLCAATDDNPELRLTQVVDSINAMMDEDYIAGASSQLISLPGEIVLELLGDDFPTDPEEIAQYQLGAETEKMDFIIDMIYDSNQFVELVQLMAQTGYEFKVKFGDINHPDACIWMDFTNAELNEVVASYEDYAKDWDDRIVDYVGTVDTVPDVKIDMAMLEDPATSLELMMANYNWDNEDKGDPNRIWREDAKVIAKYIVDPEAKADMASSVGKKEDLEYLGYAFVISAYVDGSVEEEVDEEDFDWLTFFCVVLKLGYDMEIRLMDSPDDPAPFIIPIPVSELQSALFE